MLLADRFGLVALIAKGYRALAAIFLLIYVVPLMTLGVSRLWRQKKPASSIGRHSRESGNPS
jgi:uncharacterized membrane protein YkvI